MLRKRSGGFLIFSFLVVLCLNAVLLYVLFRPKYHDVVLELGNSNYSLNDFIVSKIYNKNTTCLTNIDEYDLDIVGEYPVEFSYKNQVSTVYLKVVDSTDPDVELTNLTKPKNYFFNPNDFILSVSDESKYQVYSDFYVSSFDYGEYDISIYVIDKYGNKTTNDTKLVIAFNYDVINHEAGKSFKLSELTLNPNDGEKLDKNILKQVNVNKVGEYDISYSYEDKTYETKVNVVDTTAPDLKVKNIVMNIGDKAKNNSSFVESCSDNTTNYSLSYKGELDYSKIGVQTLEITATDDYGNTVTKKATLTIKEDNVGPVFSGLSTLTVSKGSNIDYKSGVKAVDKRDGNVSFTYDDSKVNLNKAGTYYVTYKSSDSSNNITTKKRKVVVSHTAEDRDKLFDAYYDKYLKGKSVLGMVKAIRSKYTYTHAKESNDPLWDGLVNKKGNCIVHAYLVKAALDKAGVKNMIIHTKDKTHYWNLVYENGSWCHYDSTPGRHLVGPVDDDTKFNSVGLHGRDWDRSVYPAATCETN